MKLKKSLANNSERITSTQLADYVFQSRRFHLKEGAGNSEKLDIEKGKAIHKELGMMYDYLKNNPGFSKFALTKYLNIVT